MKYSAATPLMHMPKKFLRPFIAWISVRTHEAEHGEHENPDAGAEVAAVDRHRELEEPCGELAPGGQAALRRRRSVG
jgi:hypothetical protein